MLYKPLITTGRCCCECFSAFWYLIAVFRGATCICFSIMLDIGRSIYCGLQLRCFTFIIFNARFFYVISLYNKYTRCVIKDKRLTQYRVFRIFVFSGYLNDYKRYKKFHVLALIFYYNSLKKADVVWDILFVSYGPKLIFWKFLEHRYYRYF